MSDWPHPAYVVRTPRLVLACYQPGDVDDLQSVIHEHHEALLAFLPFMAYEPRTREERLESVRRFRGLFDLGHEFLYTLRDRESGAFVGGAGLHPRTSHRALEIGYWIVPPRWGAGLAKEAAAALTQVAFRVLLAQRVEIRVVPKNERSVAVARGLGFREEGRLRAATEPRGGAAQDLIVYSMLPGELEGSAAGAIEITHEGLG